MVVIFNLLALNYLLILTEELRFTESSCKSDSENQFQLKFRTRNFSMKFSFKSDIEFTLRE